MKRETKNTIHDALKAYRLRRLWTMQEMADAAGLSVGTIHSFESGRARPTDLTLAKIKARLRGFDERKIS